VRGRLGYAIVPDTMIYGTGGLAFGHVNVSQSLFSTGFAGTYSAAATTSDTKTGWVIGAGIESMITPDWMLRLEYLHYDLGTVSSSAQISGPFAAGTSAQANYQVNGELARAALSYKFH
jgi:outer membrane immunogenic protein